MPVSSGIRTKNNSSNLSTPDTNAALVKSPASESISKWKIPHYYKRSSNSNSSSGRSSRNNNNSSNSSNGNGRNPTNSTGNGHGSPGFGNQGFSSSNSTPKKLIIEEVKGRLSKARRNGKEMVFVNYTVQDDTSAIDDNRSGTDAGSGSNLKGTGSANTGAKNNSKGSRNVDTVRPPSQPKPPIPTNHGHVSSRKPTRKRMLKIFNSSSSSTSFPGTTPNPSAPASVEQLVPTSTYMNRSISSPNLITEEVVMPTMRPGKLKKSYTNMSLRYASRVRKSSIPKNARNQSKQSTTPPSAPVSVSEPVYTNESSYFNLASVNPDTTLSPLSQQQNGNDNVDNINAEGNMNNSSGSGFLNDTVIVEEEVVPTSNNPTSISFGGANANYVNMFQLSDSPTIAPFQYNSQKDSGNDANSNNFTDTMQNMVYTGLDFNDQLSVGAASHALGNTHGVLPSNDTNFSQAQAQMQSYGSMRPMYRNSTGNIAGIAPDVRLPDQQQQVYIGGPQYGTPTIKEEETQPMTSAENLRKGSKDNFSRIDCVQ